MTSRTISFLVTLFCLFFAIQASPLSLEQRASDDVFVPQIITPTKDTVWVIGQTGSVQWVTSDAPKNISNGASVILYAYPTPGHPITLTRDFDLRSGQVDVPVPDVIPGYYYITLFGDSGDRSQPFWIDYQA